MRRITVSLVLMAVLVGIAAWSLGSLARASALTTSYSAVLPERESLVVDIYETLTGLAFYRATADRLLSGKTSDRERLETLLRWTHENVRPQFAAPGRVVADNFIDIPRRGYGYCDQTTHVFATLATFGGYEARQLFLRRADGVSPHTVTEVRLGDRWVLVDAWLGTLFTDDHGSLIGVQDLKDQPSLPAGYGDLGLEREDFERGTTFRTFPYQDFAGFVQKVWNKAARLPVLDVPDDATRRTLAAASPSVGEREAPTLASGLDPLILTMDAARRAHLEGRYDDAIAGYRLLLEQPLPKDMERSVRFFVGLALLRARDAGAAIVAFDAAIGADPNTPWRPSVLYYRAEAREQLGDIQGAIADLRAARIPPADVRLAALGAT